MAPGIIVPKIFDRAAKEIPGSPRVRSVVAHRHNDRPSHFDTRRRLDNPDWQVNLKAIAGEIGCDLDQVALTSNWTHGYCIDASAYRPGQSPRDLSQGEIVHVATEPGYTKLGMEGYNPNPPGDAIITHKTGLGLLGQGADCTGGLILDPIVHAIGVIHGGWKAMMGGVVADTRRKMREAYGSDPANWWVLVCPGAGIPEFQLGKTTPDWEALEASAIGERFARFCTTRNPDGTFAFDTQRFFIGELRHHGVDFRKMEVIGDDTLTCIDPETGEFKWHSARREGDTIRGNNAWGLVMID